MPPVAEAGAEGNNNLFDPFRVVGVWSALYHGFRSLRSLYPRLFLFDRNAVVEFF